MEVISYIETKEDVFACMESGLRNNHDSIDSAFGYTTYESIDTAEDITDLDLIEIYTAVFLFEIQHGKIEKLGEMYATHWIYQYLINPEYRKQIPDSEELDKDIEYIRGHHNVQFKRLKCYDESKGIE